MPTGPVIGEHKLVAQGEVTMTGGHRSLCEGVYMLKVSDCGSDSLTSSVVRYGKTDREGMTRHSTALGRSPRFARKSAGAGRWDSPW